MRYKRNLATVVVATLAERELGKGADETCHDCGARLTVGDVLRDTCPRCKAVLRMQPGDVPF